MKTGKPSIFEEDQAPVPPGKSLEGTGRAVNLAACLAFFGSLGMGGMALGLDSNQIELAAVAGTLFALCLALFILAQLIHIRAALEKKP